MAKHRKRRTRRPPKQNDYPGWLWMLFGLAIGLSVAFAVYVKDRKPDDVTVAARPEPANLKSAIDDNGESLAEPGSIESPKERFNFYEMLPAFEIIIDDEEPDVNKDVEPQAIDKPGVYLLQAGSFSTHKDADRRRAELALQGIVSRVQRASVNDRDYFRVYIGPIDDLDELNLTRSRLRAAKIDVMRIRLGD
jgi:cell division protein FtsN